MMDLTNVLRAEREAWLSMLRSVTRGDATVELAAMAHAIGRTDQALAALETRPTLAEVEAAMAATLRTVTGWRVERAQGAEDALSVLLSRLRALYARGGVE